MDVSEKYIVMCKAAEEIQEHVTNKENRKRKIIYYYEEEDEVMGIESSVQVTYSAEYPNPKTVKVWLPTQDQFQEIYGDPSITTLIYEYYHFIFGEQYGTKEERAKDMEYSCNFKSIEQWWLGFIMLKKYKKRWDGEKWEKI